MQDAKIQSEPTKSIKTKNPINLEDIIFILSIIFLLLGFILELLNVATGIFTLILNTFSTIILSWIMTKKSAKQEFTKQQEELARLSFRHLGDVERSILGLEQSLIDFRVEHEDVKADPDLIKDYYYFVKNLSDRIGDARNGIESNKLNWYDMLSEDEKIRINSKMEPETKIEKAFFPDVKSVFSSEINEQGKHKSANNA